VEYDKLQRKMDRLEGDITNFNKEAKQGLEEKKLMRDTISKLQIKLQDLEGIKNALGEKDKEKMPTQLGFTQNESDKVWLSEFSTLLSIIVELCCVRRHQKIFQCREEQE